MPFSSTSMWENNSNSCGTVMMSSMIHPGSALHLPLAWKMAESKSQVPQTARWLSMPWTVVPKPSWLTLRVCLHSSHPMTARCKWPTYVLLPDSNSPTFQNLLNGQLNLHNAVHHRIHCKLSAQKAVTLVLVLSTIQGLAYPNLCQALYSGQNQDLTSCFLCPQFAVIDFESNGKP